MEIDSRDSLTIPSVSPYLMSSCVLFLDLTGTGEPSL